MNLHPPRAICFDLDGTLVDSVADLTVACNLMLAEHNLPSVDEVTVRGYIGDGAKKLVARALGERGEDPAAALRSFRSHYAQHMLDHTRPYPGVAATLAVLEARGITMGVVSNKPHDFSLQVVQGVHLAQYFASVRGAENGVPVKPAPEPLLRVLADLRVAPAEAWMVGDSRNDVKAAQAAGCIAIALSYGIGRLEDLRALRPAVILDSFPKILELFAEG
jgi:phosphoglycolate phosphatase